MADKIVIHYTIEKNEKVRKRRAVIDPNEGIVEAIELRAGGGQGKPDGVIVNSDTPNDKIEVGDAGPGLCYRVKGGDVVCW